MLTMNFYSVFFYNGTFFSFRGWNKLFVPHTAIPNQTSVEITPQVQTLPLRHHQLLLHPPLHVKIVHWDGTIATHHFTIVSGTPRMTTVHNSVIHMRTLAKQPMKHAVHVEVAKVKMAEEIHQHRHHPAVLRVRSSLRSRSTLMIMVPLTTFSGWKSGRIISGRAFGRRKTFKIIRQWLFRGAILSISATSLLWLTSLEMACVVRMVKGATSWSGEGLWSGIANLGMESIKEPSLEIRVDSFIWTASWTYYTV